MNGTNTNGSKSSGTSNIRGLLAIIVSVVVVASTQIYLYGALNSTVKNYGDAIKSLSMDIKQLVTKSELENSIKVIDVKLEHHSSIYKELKGSIKDLHKDKN